MTPDNNNPKSIIVKLNSRSYKDEILAAIRRQKGITVDKIGFNTANSKIYINDHLTLHNQLLFKKTRDYCKTKDIKCWTRDCKIYLKHPRAGRNMWISDENMYSYINKFELLIVYQNVRGLRSKTHEFYISTLSSNADIVCLSETWLNSNVNSAELFDVNKYNVFRRDRDLLLGGKKDGGGVLIAINRKFQAVHQTNWSSEGICEDLWISINIGGSRQLHLCCVYVPPYASVENLKAHLHSVSAVRQSHEKDDILVIGDYNIPNISWTKHNSHNYYTALITTDGFGESLIDSFNYLEIQQYNGVYNNSDKLLDLVFCSIDNVFVDLCTNPLVPEDIHHKSLDIYLKIDIDDFNLKCRNTFYKLQFFRENYDLINSEIDKINWELELCNLNV
ncbi:hypothetical protein NQ318_001702 [Aromia moschata]|uniref:Endonuclease/exonuclease/phosphatase domain-containing protein n=1 Tax=Aromia moschata TaxID=1265417 RepID=A0AAV8Y6Y6_9CUCU|nr:hypothetical protein NQ318_001702 [Aromia moschata]